MGRGGTFTGSAVWLWFPSGSPATWGRQFGLPAQFGRHFLKFNNYLFFAAAPIHNSTCTPRSIRSAFQAERNVYSEGSWTHSGRMSCTRAASCLKDMRASPEAFHWHLVCFEQNATFIHIFAAWMIPDSERMKGRGCISGRLIKHHSGSPMRSLTCWSLVSFTELILGIGLFLLQWERSAEYAGREPEMLKSRDDGAPFGRRGKRQLPKKRRNDPSKLKYCSATQIRSKVSHLAETSHLNYIFFKIRIKHDISFFFIFTKSHRIIKYLSKK